jgi:flagellar export protein FliJ
MAKFVFTMHSVYDLKVAEERKMKLELATANENVRKLEAEKTELEDTVSRTIQKMNSHSAKGMTAGEYRNYYSFIDLTRENIEKTAEKIKKAQQIADKKQEQLNQIYKDKKALEKLSEEQYKEFLKEEAIKESKELEDILRINTLDVTETSA